MGINLGEGNVVNPLNLRKNDMLNLSKREPGLKNIIIGAGWDVSQGAVDFDLDIAAFLVGKEGKVEKIPEDCIFFNNMRAQGIELEGDNRTGAGEGDDERIRVSLENLPNRISKIVISVTIFEGRERRQAFGMVENSYIRILNADKDEEEIAKFNLKSESSAATALIFAEITKESDEWHFKAIGEAKIADLNGLLALYM
ncbi:MAG: TerD family protein [Sarcina sp.]